MKQEPLPLPPSVEDLIEAGYVQVSRRYRMLARVPPGLTGRQALDAAAPGRYHQRLSEDACAEQYRRVYARGTDVVTLTREDFIRYLQLTR